MAYDFFLDKMRLPVPPSKLSIKINGNNQTMTLINEGEINILKMAGLSDISFTVLLPNVKYPFARYDGGYKSASFFIDELERLKTGRSSFQFIVSRITPAGKVLFDTNIKVSLEDYKIRGFDITVEITLKQYKNYGTKTIEIKQPTLKKTTATVEQKRPVSNPPAQKTYTVIRGDTLWNISQKQLGNGNRFREIYKLNQSVIDGRNKGTRNTKYTIYPGQVFKIP
jgi:LysM repeat protein